LRFEVPKIIPVSTIGAGDNFNAGIVAAVIRENITKKLLASGLDKEMVSKIISLAVELSQEVCMSQSNYIAKRF
jgi:fructokinase